MRRLLLPLAAGIALAGLPLTAASADPPPLTPENVRAFLDEEMPRLLAAGPVPGAAVSVVSGGKQLFAGGYGLADIAAQKPVGGDTGFFIASVAKLFTATAVMQQAERGALDLETDVNEYLDFDIPDTYPGEPITLRNLLTHTSGFNGLVLGSGARDAAGVVPLGEFLREHVPSRVRPPGVVSSYDNYGVALAGYIVETVARQPFADYVRDNITGPLGMSATTFAQPAPEAITASLATGYTPVDGEQRATGGQYGHDAPAGAGTVSTAADMARFMIAQLDDGGGLVSPGTAEMMQRRQWGNHPGLPGLGLIWMEQFHNGHRTLGHGGDSVGFHGRLTLIPGAETGIWVGYNGDGDGTVDPGGELLRAFMDRFFPGGTAPARAPGNTEGLAGTYLITRMSSTDATRVLSLLMTVTVTPTADGGLDVGGTAFTPAEGDLWVSADGLAIGFRRTADGTATHMFYADMPAESFERLSWYQQPNLHLAVIGFLLLTMPVTGIWWLVSALRRRGTPSRPAARLARAAVGVFYLSILVAAVALVTLAGRVQEALVDITSGGSALVNLIPAMFTVALLAGVATAGFAAAAWRDGWWTVALRVHYTVVAAAFAAFLALAGYYQLLGWPVTARL